MKHYKLCQKTFLLLSGRDNIEYYSHVSIDFMEYIIKRP